MIYILATIYYFICLYWMYSNRKRVFTASFIFVVMQIVMFTGVLTIVDTDVKADIILVCLYFASLVFFLSGVYLSSHATIKKNRQDFFSSETNNEIIKEFSNVDYSIMLVMLFVGFFLCARLYLTNGNVLLQGFKALQTGGNSDLRDFRYSYTQISGIGYISQFKGVIIPFVIICFITQRKNRLLFWLGVVMCPFELLFLAGTGQRGQFVTEIIIVIIFLMNLKEFYNFKIPKRLYAVLGIVFVIVFGVLSIVNVRTSSESNAIIGVVDAFRKRVLYDNQYCDVMGFRYIYNSCETVWGYDWFHTFKDILPGKNDYTAFAYVIHGVIWGSTRGTAPVSIWSSSWYNWNIVGALFTPFIMGIIYGAVDKIFLRKKKCIFTITIYAFTVGMLGTFIGDTPQVLVNNGIISIILLNFILKNTRSKELANNRIS